MKDTVSDIFKYIYSFLGCILAAPSVISLIQRAFQFGLAQEMAALLAYYKAIFTPIANILWIPVRYLLFIFSIDIEMPEYFVYIEMISILCGGVLARSLFLGVLAYYEIQKTTIYFTNYYESDRERALQFAIKMRNFDLIKYTLSSVALSLTGIGSVGILYVVGSMMGFYLVLTQDNVRNISIMTAISGWMTLVAVILFYAVNQFMLHN